MLKSKRLKKDQFCNKNFILKNKINDQIHFKIEKDSTFFKICCKFLSDFIVKSNKHINREILDKKIEEVPEGYSEDESENEDFGDINPHLEISEFIDSNHLINVQKMKPNVEFKEFSKMLTEVKSKETLINCHIDFFKKRIFKLFLGKIEKDTFEKEFQVLLFHSVYIFKDRCSVEEYSLSII